MPDGEEMPRDVQIVCVNFGKELQKVTIFFTSVTVRRRTPLSKSSSLELCRKALVNSGPAAGCCCIAGNGANRLRPCFLPEWPRRWDTSGPLGTKQEEDTSSWTLLLSVCCICWDSHCFSLWNTSMISFCFVFLLRV